MKKCGIYCIENTVNGKKYIGKSKDIESRFRTHKCLLKRDVFKGCCNRHLWRSVKTHGLDKFKFWIVEDVEDNDELLARREEHWMEFYQSYDRDRGYNIIRVSTVTKYTPEHCAKISISLKGKRRTAEQLKNLSEAHKGYVTPESSKQKLRFASTKFSYEQYDLTGNLIKTYATQKDLKDSNITLSRVTECCNNIRSTHLKTKWRKIPFVGLSVMDMFGGIIDPNDWRFDQLEAKHNMQQDILELCKVIVSG